MIRIEGDIAGEPGETVSAGVLPVVLGFVLSFMAIRRVFR